MKQSAHNLQRRKKKLRRNRGVLTTTHAATNAENIKTPKTRSGEHGIGPQAYLLRCLQQPHEEVRDDRDLSC